MLARTLYFLVTLAVCGCTQLGSFSSHDEPTVKSTTEIPKVEAESAAEPPKVADTAKLDTTDNHTVRESLERMMDGWKPPRRRALTQAIGRCITASGVDDTQPESVVLKSLNGLTAAEILKKAEALEEAEYAKDTKSTAQQEPEL